MKKPFALLLVLALLIPMGLCNVAGAEESVATKPFYALGWSDFDNETYPHLDGLVWSTWSVTGNNKDTATITIGGASVTYGSYTDADVTKFAETLKKTMDTRPMGTRYWHTWIPQRILKMKPENVIFLDFGVDQMRDILTATIKKYKEIGGTLDGIVIDTEYNALSSHYIKTDTSNNPNNAVVNPRIYKQIVDDPRYAAEVRPLLEERGFRFYDQTTDYTSEIYGISGRAGSAYSNCSAIWDTVMRNRLNAYIDEYAYEPLKTYFPDATLSDYQSSDSKPWLKFVAVTDDGVALTGGNSHKAGNVSTFSFYHARPAESFFKELSKYAGYNSAFFAPTAFNMFLFEANYAKHMYMSTDTKKIAPWITSYVYNEKREGTLANTPYYTEQLLHLGLLDPQPFLSYTYTPEYTDAEWVLTQQVMNDALAELTRVAGFSDRKPIEMAPYWNSEFVLSGMYANGRNVWRITPNTDEISLENFKTEDKDPTFRVKGQTVSFPGGKIVETAAITNAGTCGYWVETAKDVMPVVTNDAHRFDKYPALLVDFEDAKDGKFDYNSSKPAKTWEFTWKKNSTSTIKTVDGNKVLALFGDTEVRSAKLPANVTAGDTYAKDQAWALTVTVPEGLAATAEILLLHYTGEKTETDDGGFKIAGGKAYYSENGEYKELMDITAGTYTFKRLMDFNDGKAFSTYYVYDAAGKELKATQKVEVPVFEAITNIKFATVGADKDVLFDNFKLCVTGTAADFSLYNANTGMPVDAFKANAVPTAFRLSWLNATGKEETATVKANIYEGETLKETKVIKDLKMSPGCDGVETGIVEITAGQSVKVYVESSVKVTILQDEESPTAPTEPDTDPTAVTSDPAPTESTPVKKGNDALIIGVIAAAAVVAVAVVVLVVIKSKKKAN